MWTTDVTAVQSYFQCFSIDLAPFGCISRLREAPARAKYFTMKFWNVIIIFTDFD